MWGLNEHRHYFTRNMQQIYKAIGLVTVELKITKPMSILYTIF